MKELLFHRDGKQIYGRLHLPEGSGLFPAVIIGHRFGGNLTGPEHYAIDYKTEDKSITPDRFVIEWSAVILFKGSCSPAGSTWMDTGTI